ncbi:MAG: HAD family hydrolase [Ruminococcaceae bacterium]|nr:HAD family hydrolase [Oscillospiraceae bacterium]
MEYCIWDFNGTILDDVEAGICAVNRLLADRGMPCLPNKEAYREVFGFPIRTYYERLGFDFAKEPYEVIAPLWVEQYLHYVKSAEVFPDVRDTLIRLRERGVRQVVLSATECGMLCEQLSELGLTDFFEEILGLDNIHAASKLSLAQDWRERHPDASVLWLGDTDHDAEVAERIGARCVLIARGHQSARSLGHLGVPVYGDLRSVMQDIFTDCDNQ